MRLYDQHRLSGGPGVRSGFPYLLDVVRRREHELQYRLLSWDEVCPRYRRRGLRSGWRPMRDELRARSVHASVRVGDGEL